MYLYVLLYTPKSHLGNVRIYACATTLYRNARERVKCKSDDCGKSYFLHRNEPQPTAMPPLYRVCITLLYATSYNCYKIIIIGTSIKRTITCFVFFSYQIQIVQNLRLALTVRLNYCFQNINHYFDLAMLVVVNRLKICDRFGHVFLQRFVKHEFYTYIIYCRIACFFSMIAIIILQSFNYNTLFYNHTKIIPYGYSILFSRLLRPET